MRRRAGTYCACPPCCKKSKSKPNEMGSIWKGKTTPSVNRTPPWATSSRCSAAGTTARRRSRSLPRSPGRSPMNCSAAYRCACRAFIRRTDTFADKRRDGRAPSLLSLYSAFFRSRTVSSLRVPVISHLVPSGTMASTVSAVYGWNTIPFHFPAVYT